MSDDVDIRREITQTLNMAGVKLSSSLSSRNFLLISHESWELYELSSILITPASLETLPETFEKRGSQSGFRGSLGFRETFIGVP